MAIAPIAAPSPPSSCNESAVVLAPLIAVIMVLLAEFRLRVEPVEI